MTALTCPYCGAYADFKVEHEFNTIGGQFGVWSCAACGKPVTGARHPQEGHPLNPEPKDVRDPSFPDVPDSIARDAIEAHRCFAVTAYRAAAAMARRAIQSSAYDKEAPGDKLVAQIQWMAVNGHVTEQMRELATHLRLQGNIGAHPDKDGLEDVDEEAATEILMFLDEFLRFVYQIPARLAQIKARTTQAP